MNNLNIILLHGWLLDSSIWVDFKELFPKNTKVFTPNLPGYGENREIYSTNEDFCLDYFSKITKPSALIGWSYGGLLSLKYACNKYPQIKKLVIINSNLNININNTHLNHKNIIKLKEDLISDRNRTIKEFLFECCKNSEFAEQEYKIIINKLSGYSLPSNKTLIDNLDYMIDSNHMSCISNSHKDILIINGSKDQFTEGILKAHILNSNVKHELIEGMGHIPFIFFKEKVFKLIMSFLNS
jgi:pimeloyl-[acyl-carrier protein] methyl ester esterase